MSRGTMAARGLFVGGLACIASLGCLPRDRINAACRWTNDTAMLMPAGEARRHHLIEDMRLAEDLGIRYGDAVGGRINNAANRDARARCTDASVDEIVRRHGATPAEVAAARGARELRIDLFAVFLPMTLLFLVASFVIARRLDAGYRPEDRAFVMILLAALTPIVAALALAITQMWGVTVEQLRLRDEHISYRAFALPASRHGWLLWGIAMLIFLLVSVGSSRIAFPRRARQVG